MNFPHITFISILILIQVQAQDFHDVLWSEDPSNTPVKDTSGTGQTPSASGARDNTGEYTFRISTSSTSSTQRQEWKYDRRSGLTRMQLKFKIDSAETNFDKIAVAQCHDDQSGSAGVFSIYQVRRKGERYVFGVQGDTTEANNDAGYFRMTEIQLDTWYCLDIKTNTAGVDGSYEYAELYDENRTSVLWSNLLEGGGDSESYYKFGAYRLTNGYGPVSVTFTDFILETGERVQSSPFASLSIGQEMQLNLSAETTDDVVFTSSDLTVAQVNSDGLVLAKTAGMTLLNAHNMDDEVIETFMVSVSPQIEESDNRINLALNKRVFAQEDQSHNPPTHLTDGEIRNRYSVEFFPQSMIIDLEESQYLASSELITYEGRDYNYTIAISDGILGPYLEVVDQSKNLKGESNIDSINASGRYIKITITGAEPTYSGDWISLQEFRVFGESPTSSSYTSWADTHDMSSADPQHDEDHDGMSNLIEYALGNSPTVYNKGFSARFEENDGIGKVTFIRNPNSLTDTKHYLEYSVGLRDWIRVDVSTDLSSNVTFTKLSDTQEEVECLLPHNNDISQEACFFYRFTTEAR